MFRKKYIYIHFFFYVCIRIFGIKGIFIESFNYSSSQKIKLKQIVDLRLTNYKAGNIRNGEYLSVRSWDLEVFIEINKYIFTVVRSKALNMHS